MDQPESVPGRTQARHYVAMIVIGVATAQALGMTLKAPTQMGANDISRWCTVWSLLERGSYTIDDCPWQSQTQDKVFKVDPFAPAAVGEDEPVKHFYSSKPPLLPTLIAGLLYPFRAALGVPLDHVVTTPRIPRYVPKDDPTTPGKKTYALETPKEPVKWPVYVLYFKPVVLLLNVLPLAVFLVLYARFLDRHAPDDWAWFLSLFTAAWGTYLLAFQQTLNNHTIAAFCALFALYPFVRIWDEGARGGVLFASAGFFAALCACNELPAALFGILLFVTLAARFPKPTLTWFVPAAVVPIATFLTTQYLAFGKFRPVYEEFGTESYLYEGSFWSAPLEMDWFNDHPEPWPVYLFHMTFGHHGVFSLSPIFLFSAYGAFLVLRSREGRLRAVAAITTFLTLALLAFYTWNPKARNYGGSTQGLRWLFWMIPFWLLLLPAGLEAGARSRRLRLLSLAALMVSVVSVGYALRTPWSHPWMLDAMEHLGLYGLKR